MLPVRKNSLFGRMLLAKDVSTGSAIKKIHKNGFCVAKNKMWSELLIMHTSMKINKLMITDKVKL